MHIVCIVAHPTSQGFVSQICSTIARATGKKHSMDIIDLYGEKTQLPFLSFEENQSSASREYYQNRLSKADHIIFAHPLWWGGHPAILKNFLDNILSPGFAYTYHYPKPWWLPKFLNIKPKGLLPKPVEVYITCDAPVWLYALLLFPFFSIWYFFIINFCGMHLRGLHLYGRMKWKTAKKREKILRTIEKRYSRL